MSIHLHVRMQVCISVICRPMCLGTKTCVRHMYAYIGHVIHAVCLFVVGCFASFPVWSLVLIFRATKAPSVVIISDSVEIGPPQEVAMPIKTR